VSPFKIRMDLLKVFWSYVRALKKKIPGAKTVDSTFAACSLFRLLIAFSHDRSQMVWRGYMYAILMFVIAFLQSMMLNQYIHRRKVIGMRIRSALVTAVYKKVELCDSFARPNNFEVGLLRK